MPVKIKMQETEINQKLKKVLVSLLSNSNSITDFRQIGNPNIHRSVKLIYGC